jgi:hypothetical protein
MKCKQMRKSEKNKRCSRCGLNKPISAFYKSHAKCKQCCIKAVQQKRAEEKQQEFKPWNPADFARKNNLQYEPDESSKYVIR